MSEHNLYFKGSGNFFPGHDIAAWSTGYLDLPLDSGETTFGGWEVIGSPGVLPNVTNVGLFYDSVNGGDGPLGTLIFGVYRGWWYGIVSDAPITATWTAPANTTGLGIWGSSAHTEIYGQYNWVVKVNGDVVQTWESTNPSYPYSSGTETLYYQPAVEGDVLEVVMSAPTAEGVLETPVYILSGYFNIADVVDGGGSDEECDFAIDPEARTVSAASHVGESVDVIVTIAGS